jgi:hypothetical protein
VIGAIGGNGGAGYNPEEPRDERGRWTGGGLSKWRNDKLTDRSASGRAASLAGHAYVHLPERLRRRLGWPDQSTTDRLAGLIRSWNGAANLDDDEFRERYLSGSVSALAAHHLRQAAAQAARAETKGDMAEAGRHLAAAIGAIGIDNWPYAQRSAVEKAEVEDGRRKDALLQQVQFSPESSEPITKPAGGPKDIEGHLGSIGLALTAAELLSAMDRSRERGSVEDALKKFNLDRESIRDVLAARAYVWGKNEAPGAYFRLPWTGPVNEAVAQALLANEIVHSGMLGAATRGDREAGASIDRLVFETIDHAEAPAEQSAGQQPDDKPQLCPDPEPKNEGMSDDARAYQMQITGLPPFTHMMLNGVDFDGCDEKTGNMLEAKARYLQFLDDDTASGWDDFFLKFKDKGWAQLRDKAEVQNWAAFLSGRRVEYHFAEERVADLVRESFRELGFKNIDVIWTKPSFSLTGTWKKS